MKIPPLVAIALAALAFPAVAENDDEEPVQTQAEMNQQAAADFEKADEKLNEVYKKLKTGLDESQQSKLKTAQRAWLAYRDAEAVLEAANSEGGSIYPLVYRNVQTRLTEARTKELIAILNASDPDGTDGPRQ